MGCPDKPAPPTHLNRPRQSAPTIKQKIRQAQTYSGRYRKKPVTLPTMPKFKKDA
ncbi:hypothetical protein [Leisingera sp. M523]|uniref:hypothetical protein n=1 Tax=Leisingera sp. M523 TaxID=2867013 RepID=UPI0021A8A5A8|nr:hypothetical protein [Leisingera sp. M523]UWQ30206.1 hypothetical protein K3557_06630 [Leisingera sp. M523]